MPFSISLIGGRLAGYLSFLQLSECFIDYLPSFIWSGFDQLASFAANISSVAVVRLFSENSLQTMAVRLFCLKPTLFDTVRSAEGTCFPPRVRG